jgi:hypothetical protein
VGGSITTAGITLTEEANCPTTAPTSKQYSYANCGQDKLDILAQLKTLDLETCSAEDVEKIIGNNSWTTLHCSACRGKHKWIITVGEEPDYESRTASLCRPCFDEACEVVLKGSDV